MFSSFFSSSTAPVAVAPKNKYFNKIMEEFKNRLGEKPPTAAVILASLLNLYKKTAEDAYVLGYIPVSTTGLRHKHVNDAKTCLQRLKIRGSVDVQVKHALTYLNDVKNIDDPTGDFELLLSTFFSFYPEYLEHCNSDLLKIVQTQNFWGLSSQAWQHGIATNKDMISKQNAKSQYNRFEQLAALVPNQFAGDYADSLLASIDGGSSAIHRGWVYLAIGKLYYKLSPNKRTQVFKELASALDNYKGSNISIIGLSYAIHCFTAGGPLRDETAERLYLFVSKNSDEVLKLFGVNYFFPIFYDNDSVYEQYGNRLFSTLMLYQHSYASLQKNTILLFLTTRNNIYPLREGISTLRSWLSPSVLQDLEAKLVNHPEATKLIPFFWPWLGVQEYRRRLGFDADPVSREVCEIYEGCREKANKELAEKISFDVSVTSLLEIHFHGATIARLSQSQCARLACELSEAAADTECEDYEEHLMKLYEVFPIYGTNICVLEAERDALARVILKSTYSAGYAQASGLYAAVSVSQNFTDDERYYIRTTLLNRIHHENDPDYQETAVLALQLYAKHASQEEQREIMTALLAMDTFAAHVLLININEWHIALNPSYRLAK